MIHTSGHCPPLRVALGLDCRWMREGSKTHKTKHMNARRWWKHIPQYPWIYHYYRRCHISSNLLRSSLSPVPWSHKSFFKWVMSGDSLSAEWNHSPWSIQDSCDRFLDQKDSAGCKCLPQWSTFRCIVFVSIFSSLCQNENHQCLSRGANGGHVTNRSLIN